VLLTYPECFDFVGSKSFPNPVGVLMSIELTQSYRYAGPTNEDIAARTFASGAGPNAFIYLYDTFYGMPKKDNFVNDNLDAAVVTLLHELMHVDRIPAIDGCIHGSVSPARAGVSESPTDDESFIWILKSSRIATSSPNVKVRTILALAFSGAGWAIFP
jgi:hypothetical protein